MGFGPLPTGPATTPLQDVAGSGISGPRAMRLSRAVSLEWTAETLTATRPLRLLRVMPVRHSAETGFAINAGGQFPDPWAVEIVPNNSPRYGRLRTGRFIVGKLSFPTSLHT